MSPINPDINCLIVSFMTQRVSPSTQGLSLSQIMMVATVATIGDESMSVIIGVKLDEEIRDRLKPLGWNISRDPYSAIA